MSGGAASDASDFDDPPDDNRGWKSIFLEAMRWLSYHGYADLADGWNVGRVEHLPSVPTAHEEREAMQGALLVVAHALNTLSSIEFVFVAPKSKSRTKRQAHLRFNTPKDLTPDERKEIVALLNVAHQSIQKC